VIEIKRVFEWARPSCGSIVSRYMPRDHATAPDGDALGDVTTAVWVPGSTAIVGDAGTSLRGVEDNAKMTTRITRTLAASASACHVRVRTRGSSAPARWR
jgi:hypothetical protein